MADGLSGVGSAPFNVQSDIHKQTESRQRIEKYFEEQQVQKEHRRTHVREETLRTEAAELTYNRVGKLQESQKDQGLVIDKEV
tara:strand:- start:126 stop:374 length:249 start_codon:yes stop_codon:yes gene_type:complete